MSLRTTITEQRAYRETFSETFPMRKRLNLLNLLPSPWFPTTMRPGTICSLRCRISSAGWPIRR